MSWPICVGIVPPLANQRLNRVADFELAEALAHASATVPVCQVLTGLGGVGKTQVVAALARRLWDARRVDLLVWVTAASRTAILTGLAEAAARVTGSRTLIRKGARDGSWRG